MISANLAVAWENSGDMYSWIPGPMDSKYDLCVRLRPGPKETIWSQKKERLIAGLVFFSAIGIAPPAYAYLDPGKGSMLVQILLGGVVGALVVGKLYWHRIKAFFGRRPPKNGDQELRESLDAYWMMSLHEHRWGTFAQLMRPAAP